MKLNLWLENGTCYSGESIGVPVSHISPIGEIVFNTSMTGYQEIFTDPSYCDQIVTMTYPLIGQYGLNQEDSESMAPRLKGIVVREVCEMPSHWRSRGSLKGYLIDHQIPGIQGIDTRALVVNIRSQGVMKAVFAAPAVSAEEIKKYFKSHDLAKDQIARSSTSQSIHFPGEGKRIVLMDYGYKRNILRSLLKRNCDVIVMPWNSPLSEILKFHPAGAVLSNGPGDPMDVPETLPVIRGLQERVPILAICMGHQLFALANGAKTEKLKFGHRGANHPVKDLKSGRTFMTSQNHGYAVIEESLKGTPLELTQINLNDGSVEGLKHKNFPSYSVQYHPEAFPGPEDTQFLFDEFMQNLRSPPTRTTYA
jgi:carbamoyl-phosphate synthase small subunit